MTKRRSAPYGYTLDGKVRNRRPAAVGKELERLTEKAAQAITAAGAAGLTRQQLSGAIGAGGVGTKSIVDALKADQKIHITAWRYGRPAYGIGNQPDVPQPVALSVPRGKRPGPDFVELAKREIEAEHARWSATWKPHCAPEAWWKSLWSVSP